VHSTSRRRSKHKLTSEAKREAVREGAPPIELVDADKLVVMLEELELGLCPIRAFQIQRGFFDQFSM